MNNKVSHIGIVEAKTSEGTVVKIANESACASCQVKSFCSLSESKSKEIVIPGERQDINVGEQVSVVMQVTHGLTAVLWAYVFPLVVLIIILLLLPDNQVPEPWSALGAIVAIMLYYCVLWVFRKRFKKKYIFEMEKL